MLIWWGGCCKGLYGKDGDQAEITVNRTIVLATARGGVSGVDILLLARVVFLQERMPAKSATNSSFQAVAVIGCASILFNVKCYIFWYHKHMALCE